ncbi:MAG TPA: ABC-2 family transporter protein [Opitutaceae bacterium]|nr:ABC-2 family transporter protein [Opitutaceae bacterium]
MTLINYIRVWLACARYSIVRTMMFRFDFIMWSLVEFFWMSVNVLLVAVIYQHTNSIAGWTEYEMLMLVGTSMIMQRLLMGFFWSNLFELGRNIRDGRFDFFLAQPGNPLFMVSTRKLDLDGLLNVFIAIAIVAYSARQLHLHPGLGEILLYAFLIACGLFIQYGLLLMTVSATFWIIGSSGIEGTYFTLFEFARLPRQAFRGAVNLIFVWLLPVVLVTNVPASTLLHGLDWTYVPWLLALTVIWVALGVFVFSRGIRRYSSASS